MKLEIVKSSLPEYREFQYIALGEIFTFGQCDEPLFMKNSADTAINLMDGTTRKMILTNSYRFLGKLKLQEEQ
jgi:hypothetical protein